MIRENTDKSGNLDNDKFARALLNYRNTPLKDIGLSPAQIIFARKSLPPVFEEMDLNLKNRIKVDTRKVYILLHVPVCNLNCWFAILQ